MLRGPVRLGRLVQDDGAAPAQARAGPRRAHGDPQERVLRGEPPRRGAPAARPGHGHHRHREQFQPLRGLVRRRRRAHAGHAVLARDPRHAPPPADQVAENIRMGCAIFRAYLKRENNNIARALARYNGSTGKRWYSDKVIAQWTRWNGADDLGRDERHAEVKPVRPLNRAGVDLGRFRRPSPSRPASPPTTMRRIASTAAARRRPALRPGRRPDCARTP